MLSTKALACYNKNQAGQFILTSLTPYIGSFTFVIKRTYDCLFSSSSLTIRFRTTVPPAYCLTLLVLNPNYTSNTCFNYRKVGHCLLDCLLPYAPCTKLKELNKLPKSDSKNNKHLKGV